MLGRWWPPRFDSIAVSSKLAAAIVALSIASLLTAGFVGLVTGWDLRRGLDDEQLVARQASAAADLRGYIRHLERTAATTATSPQTAADIAAFAAAHEALAAIPSTELNDERQSIIAAYQARYLEPISALGLPVELRDVAPDSPAATYLQFHYAIDDERSIDPDAVDDAGDGSEWTAHHVTAHPGYRATADGIGLDDLFLIDATTGNIVYSVRKRAELGTSLSAGPFSGTGLSSVVDRVRTAPAGGTVAGDLSYYIPALPNAVAFIAAPVLVGDDLVGVVALAVSSDSIDTILRPPADLTSAEDDSEVDLFLFGADGTLRTDPATYLDSPNQHLADSVEANGLTATSADLVVGLGSTAFIQSVPPAMLTAGVDGDSGAAERTSITGVETLSVVTPVGIDQIDWYLAAEIPLVTIESEVRSYAERLVAAVAALVILVAFGAVAWAATFMRPVRALGDQLGPDLERPIDVPVNAKTPLEFRQLVDNFRAMTDQIHQQRLEVRRTRQQRLDLLRALLPPVVAERIARGEAPSVDEVPRASVAVVVVLGLSEIRTNEAGVVQADVEGILADIDAIAHRHQLERIKVVGDAFFAACGHDRPFIDHAPRAVAFATEVRDLLESSIDGRVGRLGVSIGVDSGLVLTGMTADNGGVYDVWGDTVTTAHYLARLGSLDEVLITERTGVLLPDTVATSTAPNYGDSILSVEPIAVGGAR
ncbi:MAG: adenylate/guanylate cyclase domain-containing protein [Acidimicrobiales bacterium]